MIRLNKFGFDYLSTKEYVDYYQDQLAYNYNPAIDPRAEVIGDDPSNFEDKNYGNNNVVGPDAGHGTHCAGIIGALRGNEIGNDGIAGNVQIMSIRAVPNGDEWDKDIALSIRYAVDNGAQVVNMSFGKKYSPHKEGVIDAIKYAEKKGVLLIHAAGNESIDIDLIKNYPTPMYPSMTNKFSNWIEVGASTRFKDPKVKKGILKRDGLAADFSNYGANNVDVFAPGFDIYSTIPNNKYELSDGTSMAAPMVTGLAALLKSYYPNFTMLEIREIILESVQEFKDYKIVLPGNVDKEIKFGKLCITGGVINVYNAVLLAEKRYN